MTQQAPRSGACCLSLSPPPFAGLAFASPSGEKTGSKVEAHTTAGVCCAGGLAAENLSLRYTFPKSSPSTLAVWIHWGSESTTSYPRQSIHNYLGAAQRASLSEELSFPC